MRKVRNHAKVKPEDVPQVLDLLKTHTMTEVARKYGYSQSSGLQQILAGYGVDISRVERKRGNYKSNFKTHIEPVVGEVTTDESGATFMQCPPRYAAGVGFGPTVKPRGRR